MLTQTANGSPLSGALLVENIKDNLSPKTVGKSTINDHTLLASKDDTHFNGTRIRVRPYRHSDSKQVRELFRAGILSGRGSPLSTAQNAVLTKPIAIIAYSISALGLLLAARPPNRQTQYVGIALCFAGCGLFYKYYQAMTDAYLYFVNASLEDDLKDVAHHYGLKRVSGEGSGKVDGYAPTAASCFWVAESYREDSEDDSHTEIVGSIGLGECTPKYPHNDKSIADMRRMIVSRKYRRRGIAKVLLETLIDRARNQGIKTITLTTTIYQPGAVIMYEKYGWVLQWKEALPILLGDKLMLLHYSLDLTA
ncbi:acyl-CoA N-acyltransferase [Crassisporium funariophilum]|nr:acyl-CoA N-acyltransferase [Crassisporium funariophilum]